MRRRRPERRTINPDPKFNDLQISKFMNYLLTDGKKGIAEKILYDAFDIVQDKVKKILLIFSRRLLIMHLLMLR